VNFTAVALCIASQRVFVVYFDIDSVRKLMGTPSITQQLLGLCNAVVLSSGYTPEETIQEVYFHG
jgi:hypothetical protein